jgi:hypothetical protein
MLSKREASVSRGTEASGFSTRELLQILLLVQDLARRPVRVAVVCAIAQCGSLSYLVSDRYQGINQSGRQSFGSTNIVTCLHTAWRREQQWAMECSSRAIEQVQTAT